jgi:hypothetical protein
MLGDYLRGGLASGKKRKKKFRGSKERLNG